VLACPDDAAPCQGCKGLGLRIRAQAAASARDLTIDRLDQDHTRVGVAS
jgi:hypothetical protein